MKEEGVEDGHGAGEWLDTRGSHDYSYHYSLGQP